MTRTNPITKICPVCKQPFTRVANRAKVQTYCSAECKSLGMFGARPEPPNPSGLCMCGCGGTTEIAQKTHRAQGLLKGHHKRFIQSHGGVKFRGPQYIVDDESGCWIWQRATSDDGYAIWKGTTAHRVFFQDRFGTVDPTMEIHHKCLNTLCVNPDHLQAVTKDEHARLDKGKRKIDADDVRAIRSLAGSLSQQQIANKFGINQTTVSCIIRRVTWKDVD